MGSARGWVSVRAGARRAGGLRFLGSVCGDAQEALQIRVGLAQGDEKLPEPFSRILLMLDLLPEGIDQDVDRPFHSFLVHPGGAGHLEEGEDLLGVQPVERHGRDGGVGADQVNQRLVVHIHGGHIPSFLRAPLVAGVVKKQGTLHLFQGFVNPSLSPWEEGQTPGLEAWPGEPPVSAGERGVPSEILG